MENDRRSLRLLVDRFLTTMRLKNALPTDEDIWTLVDDATELAYKDALDVFEKTTGKAFKA